MRLLLLLMFLQLTMATINAASPPQTDQPGSQPDILVWTQYSGPSLDWLERQLGSFADATGHTVNIERYTLGELRKNAVVAEEGTRVADLLVGIPHDELAELVDLGLLADVSDYATAEYLADLPAEASTAFTYGSELLGLPLTLEGPALIVNTALVPAAPGSYDEFLETAVRLQRGNNAGFMYDFGNFYFSWAWFRSSGASIFSQAAGRGVRLELSSDAGVQGALALQELRFGRSLIPQGTDYQTAHELFAAGRLAFTYNGPWAVSHYFASGVPLTVMPMPPLLEGNPFSGFMSVQGVLISSSARDLLASANAAKWLVRSAAQLELARSAGRIPASIAAVDSLVDDQILYGFGLALRNSQAVPVNPEMTAVWQPMGRFLQQLDSRVHSAEQLRQLLQQAEREISGN